MGLPEFRQALRSFDSRLIGRTTGELVEKWDVTEKQIQKLTKEFPIHMRESRLWTYLPGFEAQPGQATVAPEEPDEAPSEEASEPMPVTPEPTSPPAGFNLMDFMK